MNALDCRRSEGGRVLHIFRHYKTTCGLFITLCLIAFNATPAFADDPDFLAVSAGIHHFNDNRITAEGRIEYRSDIDLFVFRPFSGFTMTNDRAMYGYGGLFMDLFFGRRLVLQPSFAVGAYAKGNGLDLGHWIQVRTQLELAWRFDDRSRLGFSLNHISNAGIGDTNPGIESVGLTYALPFDIITKGNLWE
jgi:lipid A 3-O-deacylase